jgi:hypothetical protein
MKELNSIRGYLQLKGFQGGYPLGKRRDIH